MHIDLINAIKKFIADPDTDNISLAYEELTAAKKIVANQLTIQLSEEVETQKAKASRTYARWIGLRTQLELHATKLLVNSILPSRADFIAYEVELAELSNRYHDMITQYAELWEASKIIEKEHFTKMFSCNRRIDMMRNKLQSMKRQYYPDLWC